MFLRFFWKIVDNGDGKAVAFIGDNFPGTDLNATINDVKTENVVACSNPITDIFKTANNGYNYITTEAYRSKSGDYYGEIHACRLADVQIPEMIFVRDNYMGVPGKKWDLLTTP